MQKPLSDDESREDRINLNMGNGLIEIDADDSSDEESSQAPLNPPKNFMAEISQSLKTVDVSIKKNDPEGFSFKVFNTAVECLYAPDVNKVYYEKKRTLPKSEIQYDTTRVVEILESVLKRTLQRFFDIPNQINFSQSIYTEFLAKHEVEIKKILEQYCSRDHFRGILIRIHDEQSPLSEVMLKCLNIIKKIIIDYISGLSRPADMPPFFDYNNHFHAHLTHILVNYYERCGVAENGKFKNIRERTYPPVTHLVIQSLVVHAQSFKPKANVMSSIELFSNLLRLDNHLIASHVYNGLVYYRFTHTITHENITKSPISFVFQNNPVLSTYLPVSLDQIKLFLAEKILTGSNDAFTRSFSAFFMESLPELRDAIHIKRGVFPVQHTLCINSASDYFANLRLIMRVMRRRIRQNKKPTEKGLFMGEAFQLGWKFNTNELIALTTQEVTKNCGRNEMVLNMDSYSIINKQFKIFINTIKSHPGKNDAALISDSIIAAWVRDIFLRGKPTTITIIPGTSRQLIFTDFPADYQELFLKFLISFTYLIFVCEVQRHPSSLIIHQMILDLIIANIMTWEEAIADPKFDHYYGGGAMPMTMSRYTVDGKKCKSTAVPNARLIHERFNNFATKQWIHEGEPSPNSEKKQKEIAEFIRREHEVVNRWCLFKTAAHQLKGTIFNLDSDIDTSIKTLWYP